MVAGNGLQFPGPLGAGQLPEPEDIADNDQLRLPVLFLQLPQETDQLFLEIADLEFRRRPRCGDR